MYQYYMTTRAEVEDKKMLNRKISSRGEEARGHV